MPAAKMGHATGFYNLVRNEGGSIGIAVASTILASRAQFHQARLVEHMNPYNPVFQHRAAEAARGLMSHVGMDGHTTRALSETLLYRQAQAQAMVLSYADIFWVITFVLLAFLPLIPILRGRVAKRGAPQPD